MGHRETLIHSEKFEGSLLKCLPSEFDFPTPPKIEAAFKELKYMGGGRIKGKVFSTFGPGLPLYVKNYQDKL